MSLLSRIREFLFKRPKPPGPDPLPVPGTTLFAKINEERNRRGLSELRLSELLIIAAEKHCIWMAKNRKLSHVGQGGSTLSDRIPKAYESLGAGEIIAAGQRSIEEVISSWISSRGHYEIMFSTSYEDIGTAQVGEYWCCVFGRSNRIS